jgi:hypothetical protein
VAVFHGFLPTIDQDPWCTCAAKVVRSCAKFGIAV